MRMAKDVSPSVVNTTWKDSCKNKQKKNAFKLAQLTVKCRHLGVFKCIWEKYRLRPRNNYTQTWTISNEVAIYINNSASSFIQDVVVLRDSVIHRARVPEVKVSPKRSHQWYSGEGQWRPVYSLWWFFKGNNSISWDLKFNSIHTLFTKLQNSWVLFPQTFWCGNSSTVELSTVLDGALNETITYLNVCFNYIVLFLQTFWWDHNNASPWLWGAQILLSCMHTYIVTVGKIISRFAVPTTSVMAQVVLHSYSLAPCINLIVTDMYVYTYVHMYVVTPFWKFTVPT